MLRKFIRALAGALAAALVLALAGPASAGTYTVYSCGGPAGGANNLFRGQADAGMTAYYANCPVNPYATNDNKGLVARSVKQNWSVPWLNGAYLIMDAPGGAQVGAVHFDTNMDRPGGGYWSLGVVGFGTDSDRGINTNGAMNWGCSGGTNGLCFYVGHIDVGVGKPSVRFEARCGSPNWSPCSTTASSYANAYMSVWNISVDVNDGTLPSISSVGGGLSGGSWLKGAQSISWNSSDNVGIRSASLAIDGSTRTSWNNSCDYTQVKPCGDLNGGRFDYNVDALSDGSHSLTLYVTDTAGNTNSWSRTIYTDHTAPAAPSVSASGNWQNSNSFSATVTNAAPQAAPITSIAYTVCDANGNNCAPSKTATPSNGNGGGQTTISGITLPQDGDYTVRAYEFDAAGNVSSANLSNAATAHARLDRVAPAAPTALAVDGGEDWRPVNGYRLSWTNPAGQLAPIAKAYVVVCDPTSVCQTTMQSAAGINQAAGIAAPVAGDNPAQVYLEDAAGNKAVANMSNMVHLRFDDTVPATAVLSHRNGWLNAADAKTYKQHVTYPSGQPGVTVPPSGINGYSVTTDGSDPDATLDVASSGPGEKSDWPADAMLIDLPEGAVSVKARAISGAGVAGATFDAATLKVDKTVPDATVSGAPDPGTWQTSVVKFTINGADALSGMTAADAGQDVTKGGYISWRLDDGKPTNVAGATAQASVNSDGIHTAYYRAYDVAGNASPEQSVKVRIDVTAPTGSFEAREASDPRKFVADVSDAASGVAGGTIQLRRDSGDWKSLATSYDNAGHLVAKVDDTDLPDGVYAMRAVVTDNAGNQGIVDTRADGSQMQVALPLRGSVTLSASTQVVARTSCRTVKVTRLRKGKKVHKRLRVCKPTKVPSLKKRGQKVVIKPKVSKTSYVYAQLKDAAGNPIKDAAVTIAEQPRTGGGFVDKAHLATDTNGDLRYAIAKSGPSRTIRASFDGTDTFKPSSAEVKVLVPASTTLKASKKRLRPRGRVVFRGQLAGGYVPKAGKLVNLQVFFRHKWRTFATPRATATGAWKFSYRFTARYSKPLTYRFRALVPVEQAYPFEAGQSRTVKVVVHP